MLDHQDESQDERTARQFLLGRLSDAEAEQFEERLLGDEELSELVEAIESELADAFVRGELGPEEELALRPRFTRNPERVELARLLAARATGSTERRRPWRWMAAAAAIALVSALLWRSQQSSVVPRPTPEAAQPVNMVAIPTTSSAPVLVERTATFIIALATTRDAESIPRFPLPADVQTVTLAIRLNPHDRFPSYDVALTGPDGTNVWSGHVVARGIVIEAKIPAELLRDGEHRLAVKGLPAEGDAEELGYASIVIDRGPS